MINSVETNVTGTTAQISDTLLGVDFLFDSSIFELFGAADAPGAENTLFLLLQLKFSTFLPLM